MTTLASASAVPATRQRRRGRLIQWGLRLLLGLLATLLLLLAAGFLYQRGATARDMALYPPPGQLVDVGEYRLHLQVTGKPQGSPTVILENGGGGLSPQWGWVQPALAGVTQVVTYDRPGTGWSEAPERMLSAEEAMRDLHTALQQQGIEGPYLLVGHSMGGLMMRVFATLYPDEVAGMLLVDPRDVTWDGVFDEAEGIPNVALYSTMATLSRFGLTRLMGVAAHQAEGLPERHFAEAVALGSTTHQAEGMVREFWYGETAIKFLEAREETHEWPLMVLSAGAADENFDASRRGGFTALHQALARNLSSNGEHLTLESAGHITIVMHQEHAEMVSEAILELLARLTP